MKKNFYKPVYKKLNVLRKNIQNRDKIIYFKKKKWQPFIKQLLLLKKKKIRVFDHTIYYKPKFGFNFKNKYRFYLFTKQRLKFFYGSLTDKNLTQIFSQVNKKFKNQKNNSSISKSNFFLELLESRLDIILYRTQFVQSLRYARLLISHGKVSLNGKIITINSYNVKKGDILEIQSNLHNLLEKKNNISPIKFNIPKYLEINFKTFQCIVISDISYNKIIYSIPFWLNLNYLIK